MEESLEALNYQKDIDWLNKRLENFGIDSQNINAEAFTERVSIYIIENEYSENLARVTAFNDYFVK